ncbi:MAG: hypothetical protein V3V00_04150 [Saprospiraceae bacterium]
MATFKPSVQLYYIRWINLWSVDSTKDVNNFPKIALHLSVGIVLYMFLYGVMIRMSVMPSSVYYEPIIFPALCKHLFSSQYAFFIIGLLLLLLFYHNRIKCSWNKLECGKSIKFLVVLTVAILTWVFTTYDFNLFFNQAHSLNRFLLLLFIPLVYWRPVFVFPFIIILLSVIGQFTILQSSMWTVLYLPIRILIMFCVYFMIYAFTNYFRTRDFIFLIGCLFAAHYWASGASKVDWDWIRFDQIYLLLPATYANGWLGFLDQDTISSITGKLALFNEPLKVLVLFAEFGCVFFFFRRKLTIVFLSLWIILHLGIFAVSGIFFWIWVILDMGLLILLLRDKLFAKQKLYNWKLLLISIVLIAGGRFWCHPVSLFWYDAPLNYTYHFEATAENGKTYDLPPDFFAPYDQQFTMSMFNFLSPDPLFPIYWGATSDAALPRWLQNADSDDKIFEKEKSDGLIAYNAKATDDLIGFVQQYVRNWNGNLKTNLPGTKLQAPRQLWTYPIWRDHNKTKPIKSISVTRITSVYKKGQYSIIRKTLVLEIDITQ